MYRSIEAKFWTDPKVRELSPAHKLLFLYLITNSHTHVSGIYYLPSHYVSYDTGIRSGDVQGCLKVLSDHGFIQYDPEREIVWIIHMFLYQGRGTKNDQAAAAHLSTLHQTPLIEMFLERYPQVQQYMAVKPKRRRGQMPTTLRFAVLKRDSFTCQYCGSKAPDVSLEVDHIIPKSKGGSDDMTNLSTSCQQCNHGKGDELDILSQDTLSATRDTLSYRTDQEQEIEQEQEIPPSFSPPEGENEPQWGRTWRASKRFPSDFPPNPPSWFLDWALEHVPHVNVTHEWPHMRDYTYKATRTQFFMCAQKWMENAEERYGQVATNGHLPRREDAAKKWIDRMTAEPKGNPS